ncbi:hypothetical protein MBLNU457_1272t1 [Dothideomycetes sp. NU457]
MAPGERCLWPTSFSKFLKRENDNGTAWASPTFDQSDVLLPGSDDELDDRAIGIKRRKIVHLADAFLAGTPLFIASASLKGPFGKQRAVEDEVIWREVPNLRYASTRHAGKETVLRDGHTKSSAKVVDSKERPAFVLKRRPLTQHPDSSAGAPSGSPTTLMQESRRQRALEDTRSARVRKRRHRPKHVATPRQLLDGELATGDSSEEDTDHAIGNGITTDPRDLIGINFAKMLGREAVQSTNISPEPDDSEVRERLNSAKMLGREAVLRCSIKQVPKRKVEDAPTVCSPHIDATQHSEEATSVSGSSGFTPINATVPDLQPEFARLGRDVHDARTSDKTEKSAPPQKVQACATTLAAQANGVTEAAGLYSEAAQTGESPFLFRKPKHAIGVKRANAEDDKSACVDKPEGDQPARAVASEHRNVDDMHVEHPTVEATPGVITSDHAPAIDLSFAQNSLGVNFDMIAQYTNSRLPTSPRSGVANKSVRKQLRRAMRESGALFTRSSHDPDESVSEPDSPDATSKEPLTKTLEDKDEPAAPFVPISPSPPINTQAALRDACLDLCTSATPEPIPAWKATSSKAMATEKSPLSTVGRQSPAGIIPFSVFNKQHTSERPEPAEAMVSTQAMFDAFSPFTMSTVKKSRAKKRASFALREELVHDADENDETNMTIDENQPASKTLMAKEPDEADKTLEHQTTESHQSPEREQISAIADGGWSFAALDNTPISPPEEAEPATNRAGSITGSADSDKSAAHSKIPSSFKVTKRKSSSSLPGKIPSASAPAKSQGNSASHPPSFSLSQIVDSVNETRYRDLDIGAILSQESIRPSQQRKSSSEKKRGRVTDWRDSSPPPLPSKSPKQPTEQSLVPDSIPGRLSLIPGLGSGSTVVVSSNEPKVPGNSGEDQPRTIYNSIFGPSEPVSTNKSVGLSAQPSLQEAQRQSSPDIDATFDDLGQSVLSSWDLDKEIRKGVEAH